MNVLAAIRSIVRGGALTSRARGQEDLAELLDDAIELLDEELERRGKERVRAKGRREPAPASIEKPMDAAARTLSLFSSDLQIKEREGERAPPPEPEVLHAGAPLTPERGRVAEQARVADPETCWRKFAVMKASMRGTAAIDRAWSLWCLNERQRAPPPPAAPTSETRLKVAERQRARDREDAAYRASAGPPPAELRSVLAGLAKGRAPPAAAALVAGGA